MKQAKIFLVEDDKGLAEALKSFFSTLEFTLVALATNKKDAMKIIDSNKLEEDGVNIAIIDGYFPDNNEEYAERFNGPEVAEYLRIKHPGIKIISFSSDPRCSHGDYNIKKIGGNQKLIGIIKSITN